MGNSGKTVGSLGGAAVGTAVGGPVGGIVGAGLGGMLGGLFDSDEKKARAPQPAQDPNAYDKYVADERNRAAAENARRMDIQQIDPQLWRRYYDSIGPQQPQAPPVQPAYSAGGMMGSGARQYGMDVR